jgi:hypothetical protein
MMGAPFLLVRTIEQTKIDAGKFRKMFLSLEETTLENPK